MFIQFTRKIQVLFLLLFLSTFIHAQKELRHIDANLDSIFGHYNIGKKPGVSIAIIEHNKPTVLRSYGHANLEYQIKNTPNTLFNAADLAKQFTVFSILLLQDQGKLSIHDNVKKYVPLVNEWPFDITLKHLMEQTSGLRDVVELKKWTGYQNGDVVTKQTILNLIAKQKQLNFPAGNQFEYNRTGFVLLTEVIAKVSGMSFSEFVHQHIFTPLEMNNSVFVNAHTELIPNRSYSYATTDNKFTKIVNNTSFVGGTNLYTSAADFAKWLRNMSNPKIGKSSFYEYMQTPIKPSNGKKTNYTPGIFKNNNEGYWTIHLEGFDHGYTAYMMYVPEHDFSLVFFSNDLDFSISNAYKAIYGWFNKDYANPPVSLLTGQRVKFINKSATALQSYIGDYLFEADFSTRKIVLENDTLFYVRNVTNRTPMVPIKGAHTFKMLFPSNDNIHVKFKNQGKIMEFRILLNANEADDYVKTARKFSFSQTKQPHFLGNYKNDLLDHTIHLQSTNEVLQLTVNGTSMILDQIGENVFLPLSNPSVGQVKLQRNEQQNIIGVYLSGYQINDLYYKLIN